MDLVNANTLTQQAVCSFGEVMRTIATGTRCALISSNIDDEEHEVYSEIRGTVLKNSIDYGELCTLTIETEFNYTEDRALFPLYGDVARYQTFYDKSSGKMIQFITGDNFSLVTETVPQP